MSGSDRETTNTKPFNGEDFLLGYRDGFRAALMEAAQIIRRMAKDRNRSDVNAIKASSAILELDNG